MSCGSLVWKITNVTNMLTASKTDPSKAITGRTFLSAPQGYQMRPKIFFNGARPNDRGHMSIFLQLLPGLHDAALQWPFAERVRFTLIDQQQGTRLRNDIQKDLLPPENEADEFRRPDDEPNNGYGIYKFVEHDALPGNYIVDDTMFLKLDVLVTQYGKHSDTI